MFKIRWEKFGVKGGGNSGGGEISKEKNENDTNVVPKLIYVESYIQIGQLESVQN